MKKKTILFYDCTLKHAWFIHIGQENPFEDIKVYSKLTDTSRQRIRDLTYRHDTKTHLVTGSTINIIAY